MNKFVETMDGYEINLQEYKIEKFLFTNQILFVKNRVWKVNFVGIIVILNDEGEEIKFFSRPKHSRDSSIFEVLSTIKKSTFSIENNDSEANSYVNHIYYLDNILKYYKKYGLHTERSKDYRKKIYGKVEFNQTIKKITPTFQGNNILYEKFMVKETQEKKTFVSKCILNVLKYELPKYQEILKTINIKEDIPKYNQKYIVSNLNKILKTTNNDNIKNVISNIIGYYTCVRYYSNNTKLIYATTSYHVVWELMVKKYLGNDFKKVTLNIGTSDIVNNQTLQIEIDFLNTKKKIIADAKYYSNIKKFDYKQAFYQYHLSSKLNTEFNEWKNMIIAPKPNNIYGEYKTLINRNEFDELNVDIRYLEVDKLIRQYIK